MLFCCICFQILQRVFCLHVFLQLLQFASCLDQSEFEWHFVCRFHLSLREFACFLYSNVQFLYLVVIPVLISEKRLEV